MELDAFLVISLLCLLLIIGINIKIFISAKEKKEKSSALADILTAVVCGLGLLASAYANSKNLEDQKNLLSHQYNHLRDTLSQQINHKSEITDSLETLVAKCFALKDSEKFSKSLNSKVVQGNDGKLLIIEDVSKPALNKTFNVSSLTNTNINLKSGDQVFISSSGSIKLGSFVGISGPKGRETGVLGLDISNYNIVENINHGALIFKYPYDGTWTSCGDAYTFTATHNGVLYFDVNDNDPGNNVGFYTVQVKVYKQPSNLQSNKLSGFVYDEDGNPVQDVTINVSGIDNNITTNQQGGFQTHFMTLPDDNIYSITYSKKGYMAKTLNYTEIPKTNIRVYLSKN